jgi:flagellar basal-body rod protein FlgF
MSELYTGAMGMISNSFKMDTISNNIANSQTTSYKNDDATFRVFQETNAYKTQGSGKTYIGGYENEVYPDHITTNFQEGNSEVTNNPLDVMLHDSDNSISFFEVQNQSGTYLTRSGQLQLNANRNLVEPDGSYVFDQNGNKITIPDNQNQFTVNPDGTVVNIQTNQPIARLSVVSVNKSDLGLLEKHGNGQYSVMTANELTSSFGNLANVLNEFNTDPTIQSVFGSANRIQNIQSTGQVNILHKFTGQVVDGAIEGSNVNLTDEMTQLINTQKGLNASQKVLMNESDLLDKAVNEVGK